MSNEIALDKAGISFYMTRELRREIQKAAKMAHMSVTDFIIAQLTAATKHIVLTPEDYDKIAQEMRTAQDRRTEKRIARRDNRLSK